MKCAITQALSNLSSPAKALGAARSLLGPSADQQDLDTTTTELTTVGGKLLTFGWVVKLWPILQLGWGGTADVVHDLLTGGESTLIGLHLRAVPTACPNSAQLLSTWNSAPVSARQSWAAPGIDLSGFNNISCWHSWVVAIPIADGNGWFVFSQQNGLHILSPAELQEFNRSVCSSPDSQSRWKSTTAGPADCNP